MKSIHDRQRGVVSLFVVIFSALLITTITIVFVRIMIQSQQDATTIDLSKSALDSAQAGVEDAKRAIVTYRQRCASDSDRGTPECVRLDALKTSTTCDTLQKTGIVTGAKEVIVQTSENDAKLQQAYTCVKVTLDTDDYIGALTPSVSRLIHLRAKDSYNQVTIEWFSQKDFQGTIAADGSNANKVNLGIDAVDPKLTRAKDWPSNRPALLRAQLIQFGPSFSLQDFAKNSNNSAVFLYPLAVGSQAITFPSDDPRQTNTSDILKPIACDQTFSTTSSESQYACKVTITLPAPVGSDGTNRDAYLRIDELYNTSTSFRVTMQNGSNTVKFDGVQPIVDSTGRANDLFRRVSSRIELEGSTIPNIESAVDISGSLCKTFQITDTAGDYSAGSCKDT